MNNERKEEIIKILINEEFKRKKLLKPKYSTLTLIKIIAVAASILLIVGMFILGNGSATPSRKKLAASAYEFPQVLKSRSNAKVEKYIAELSHKEYDLVLEKIYHSKNPKDLFIKYNILYLKDSLNILQAKSNEIQFDNIQFQNQIEWIYFLISFRQGENKTALVQKSTLLTEPYFSKSIELLNNIAD